MNLALFVWITYVAVSGAIFFSCRDWNVYSALSKKLQINAWFEVNNQSLMPFYTYVLVSTSSEILPLIIAIEMGSE